MRPRGDCRVRASGTLGRVTGMDIDAETIAFAAAAYPSVKFVAADVTRAGELFPARFDVIYAFNAFYAFPNQPAALSALRIAARPDAILCLFDYLDRGNFSATSFARKTETLLWQPLSLKSLEAELKPPDGAYANVWKLARGITNGTQNSSSDLLPGVKSS
jgi:SAM-dependent methyltransferase